jgi:hypothetical protein
MPVGLPPCCSNHSLTSIGRGGSEGASAGPRSVGFVPSALSGIPFIRATSRRGASNSFLIQCGQVAHQPFAFLFDYPDQPIFRIEQQFELQKYRVDMFHIVFYDLYTSPQAEHPTS